jgi:tetratricopeptide (TPR) repeat protein
MIDFSQLTTENTINTLTNPRDLFSALPNKDIKYQYPRDVQGQVWQKWYEKRNDKNMILKMNTGSGKTVVGLLILKSSINEKKVPAIYVVSDNFLVEQVIKEAKSLGIAVTTDINSTNFRRGKEILVCNIHKLVNGKSVFGIGERKIEIGSIIIDDAHACIDTVESQYTIKIPSSNKMYNIILQIFLSSIKLQNESKAIELEDSQPNAMALVPFWSWKKNLNDIRRILLANSEDDSLKFILPLLKDNLEFCRCVISNKEIEITPHVIPIDIITSLEYAQRRIFMTATLVDDSILATHFGLGIDDISNVVTPDIVGDIGDRMILIPQSINSEISDDKLKEYYKFLSKKINVVIIVPSFYRLYYWKDVSDLIITKDNIETNIEAMKNKHIGLVVLVNRYDGIDLPHNACRVLVIDGLPDSRRLIDQITESQLMGSSKSINQKIQKIEQGMGRGVRSNNDYCVVFLMGKSLISHLYNFDAISKFSSATKAQFELSEKISEQLQGKSLEEIHYNAISVSLERNEDWIIASKSCLSSLIYKQNNLDNFSISQRLAYNEARINQYDNAIQILNDAIDKNDKIVSGFSKQILAEYINYKDEAEAQKTLISAIRDNKNILKPMEGIDYKRIKTVDEQAKNLQRFLSTKYSNGLNQFIIDIDAILEDLIFIPDTIRPTAPIFEDAIKNIAYYLGFSGQRPENEYGRGPDNLWSVGNNNYFVIECKNGVSNRIINKHDINQLNGSIAWFNKEYDHSSKCTPIMIHLGNICEFGATPEKTCRVITKEKLETFKKNIKNFSIAVKDKLNQLEKIKKLLIQHKLRDSDIINNYTVKITIKGK